MSGRGGGEEDHNEEEGGVEGLAIQPRQRADCKSGCCGGCQAGCAQALGALVWVPPVESLQCPPSRAPGGAGRERVSSCPCVVTAQRDYLRTVQRGTHAHVTLGNDVICLQKGVSRVDAWGPCRKKGGGEEDHDEEEGGVEGLALLPRQRAD